MAYYNCIYMEISAKYNPQAIEDKWYAYWLQQGFFHSQPDAREPYTIVIPPPNVTGVLHMGHMLNNTIQDVLVRRARMQGKNACWVPGTDHASIATEAKVVAKLKEQGIEKSQLSREDFLKHAWEWKEKHGGIILEQLKKLGASCDWERTRFTMDADMSEAVINTFIYLYRHDLIYRGVRMVNWDPVGRTAVSDEEVIHKEVKEKLYYLKYHFSENGKALPDYLMVATTRPETIMADVAVCVHPDDPRYKKYAGKKVLIPLLNKEIPLIQDEYVSMEFGTGCLKITPAHDINDYNIGHKHKLPVIDILDESGHLKPEAQILVGEERFAARKKIAVLLREASLMEKEEPYTTQVGFSERTDAVIEPRLSMQWFVKMEALAQQALQDVESDAVRLIPGKFKNTYRHWMENVRDWCISRQLWWGQRIPAWYLPSGEFVVAATADEAIVLARAIDPKLSVSDLHQDEDVLDTWFSSWLWPVSVFDPSIPGHPEKTPNADLAYYYPANDLVTAPEILFFWVARMIMAGDMFCKNVPPFQNVYLTGIVRDKQGRKMSKSLGNSPDPLALIAQNGADGVRMGMLLCSSAGNDILFDESQVEQGRNFCNKIWNAYRLIQGWQPEKDQKQSPAALEAQVWFRQRLAQVKSEVDDLFLKFRLSEALMLLYKLFWDDFCAWYLEWAKPTPGQPIDTATQQASLEFLEELMLLLHPFMPFITEEIWQQLFTREAGESIMISACSPNGACDPAHLTLVEQAKEGIMAIRALRQAKQISPKEPLELYIQGEWPEFLSPLTIKMANLSRLECGAAPENIAGSSFRIGNWECFVPLGDMSNPEEERKKLQEELTYLEGFVNMVRKKLSNEAFVQNAPAQVIENERKKEQDALGKMASVSEQLKKISGER